MKKMILIQNNYYWVAEDFNLPLTINKQIFKKVVRYKLVYKLTEYSCERFYFKKENSKQLLSLFEFDIHKLVFLTFDDFLVNLVHRINDINFVDVTVDDYVSQEIELSKIKFPEKWI